MELNQFSLKKLIGVGAYGKVYLAYHNEKKEYISLKILDKETINRKKIMNRVLNEKKILETTHYPMIIHLLDFFDDKTHIYLMFDFINGGELFYYLNHYGKFSSRLSCFYAAEILCAINYLHSVDIIHRDIKPENIMLKYDGHIVLVDFGEAKIIRDNEKTFTFCGTSEYMAPETILRIGHDKSVDLYCLGILIFEMMAGFTPFDISTTKNIDLLFRRIVNGYISYPSHMNSQEKNLCQNLICDKKKRLTLEDVKQHSWFNEIDWDCANQGKLIPPIIPITTSKEDTRNFISYPENE